MYVQRQEMRPNLKPVAIGSIQFFFNRTKKLVSRNIAAEAISEQIYRAWWKKDALSVSARTANGTLAMVKNVFSILQDTGALKSNPAVKLERMTLWSGKLHASPLCRIKQGKQS